MCLIRDTWSRSTNMPAVDRHVLCCELNLVNMAYQRQVDLDAHHKNAVLEIKFRADLVVERRVPIENKAVNKLKNQGRAQVLRIL